MFLIRRSTHWEGPAKASKVDAKAVDHHALASEERYFLHHSPAVTAETAIGTNHAMTGHRGRVGILMERITDRAGGSRSADGLREIPVGGHSAARNARKQCEDFCFEGSH